MLTPRLSHDYHKTITRFSEGSHKIITKRTIDKTNLLKNVKHLVMKVINLVMKVITLIINVINLMIRFTHKVKVKVVSVTRLSVTSLRTVDGVSLYSGT